MLRDHIPGLISYWGFLMATLLLARQCKEGRYWVRGGLKASEEGRGYDKCFGISSH